MTIAKATRLQDDMRELFRKYGVVSGGAFVVHDNTIHFIEAHVTERNDWVETIMNSLSTVIPQINPNIPVVNYNSAQGN